MKKLEGVRDLGVPPEPFRGMPWRLLQTLKRRASHESPSKMRAHPEVVRHALLAIFVYVRTAEVIDDVLKTLVETVQKLDRSRQTQVNRALMKDSERVG